MRELWGRRVVVQEIVVKRHVGTPFPSDLIMDGFNLTERVDKPGDAILRESHHSLVDPNVIESTCANKQAVRTDGEESQSPCRYQTSD